MPQKTIEYHSLKAYEGQIAAGTYNIVRGTLLELYAGQDKVIPYGRAVVREAKTSATAGDPATSGGGSSSSEIIMRSLVLPSKAGEAFMGITVIDEMYGMYEKNLINNKERGFLPQTPVGILTFGDMWVWAEGKVRPGEGVSFRHTTDDPEAKPVGRFSNVADGEHDELPRAIWVTEQKKATGGLAILNLGRF